LLNVTGVNAPLFDPAHPTNVWRLADAGFVPQILVERVAYDDDAPWPANADGAGASLQRIVSRDYGNDPMNWRAALPTAGRPNTLLPTGTGTLFGDGTVRLAFTVQAGAMHQLQYKENLDDPEWLPFGDPILAKARCSAATFKRLPKDYLGLCGTTADCADGRGYPNNRT